MLLCVTVENEIAPLLRAVLRGTESLVSLKGKYGSARAIETMKVRDKIFSLLESAQAMVGEGI